MLIVVDSAEQLSYSAVMAIYEQSNRERSRRDYPRMKPDTARWQAEQDFWAYLQEDFFRVPGAKLCLWQEGESAICALRLQPWEDGLLLTGLETAPGARRQGAALQLMTAALAETFQPVWSHVHKENTASLALHERLGFRKTPKQAVYLDGTRDPDAWTLRLN